MADITQISNKPGDNNKASVIKFDNQSTINDASTDEMNQSGTNISIINVTSQSQMETSTLDISGQSLMETSEENEINRLPLDAAGHKSDDSKLGNQSNSSQKEHMDAGQSMEIDSPTKRFEEFAVLIGETEASMRDKLSSLTLPDAESFVRQGAVNIPIAIESNAVNLEETVNVKDSKSIPSEIATTKTKDTLICADTTDRNDAVSIAVTEEPSMESENSHNATLQPVIRNAVSSEQGNDDKVDDIRIKEMISSTDDNENKSLTCNARNEIDNTAEELKRAVPNKEIKLHHRVPGSGVNGESNMNVNMSDDRTMGSQTGTLFKEVIENSQMVEFNSSEERSSNDRNIKYLNEEREISVVEGKDEGDLPGNVALPDVSGNTESKGETGKDLGSENVEMMDLTDELEDHSNGDNRKTQVNNISDTGEENFDQLNEKSKQVGKNSHDRDEIDICEKPSDKLLSNIETAQDDELTDFNDKSCVSDVEIEDGLMIIDVRSLTDNTGNNDFNDKDENLSKEKTQSEKSDKIVEANLSETEGSNNKFLERVNKGLTSAEKQPTSVSSKNKRKSPNSVRRITEHIELTENTSTSFENNTSCPAIIPNRIVLNETDISEMNESATSALTESLPVISNTFSMKSNLQSNIIVKDEPPDDGTYGEIHGVGNIPQTHKPTIASFNSSAVNLVSGNAVIHKGQILSHGVSSLHKLGRPPSSQKLVISKVSTSVPPAVAAVSLRSSTPISLIRYPLSTGVAKPSLKVQSVQHNKFTSSTTAPIVTLRNLAPRSALPAPVQNGNILTGTIPAAPNKDKTKESNQKNLSTINIHSVGVARITDLIARKNPIPTFKPDQIPENLAAILSSKIYPCYECGDSFHFEKSLRQHLGRCSMNIFYKCEKCKKRIKFTNKCQLLNHLRSHLNIEKTQAVPIHIKSDSIEIVTNFDNICADKPFEWYKEEPLNIPVSEAANVKADVSPFQCLECNKVHANSKQLEDHFQGDKSNHNFCDECPIYLNSKCALESHKKLHKLEGVNSNKSMTVVQWRLLRTQYLTGLSCPECGKHFAKDIDLNNVSGFFNNIALHLKNMCFHLSRLPAFKCTKCMKVFQNFLGLRNHLNSCLENYYKCGLCPMALKSLKSLESHYDMKHKLSDCFEITPGMTDKIIYRCHICDTLIDDKSFLLQHTEKHLLECKKYPETHYQCLQCGQMFLIKKDLVEHYPKHSLVRHQFWCTFCSKDIVRAVPYIDHMLKSHTSASSKCASKSVIKFCNRCGLVCVGEHMYLNHACLAARYTTVVVGDKPAEKKVRIKNKPQGRKEYFSKDVDYDASDLPPNVSKTCLACSALFTSKAQRVSHLKDHRDYDSIFICRFCDLKNLNSYHELRSHEIACKAMSDMPMMKKGGMQTKEGTSQFRKIKSKAELQQQKKVSGTATETKSYANGVVLTPKENSKSSKSKQATVEYYICDKCDAVFTRKSKQEEHIKSEHGIHPCHLCGLMHESQSSLKKHLMVDHEGKRMLFYCGVCKSRKIEKSFNLRGKLIKHLKVKHRMKVIDESKIITQLPGLPETDKETTPESVKRKFSASPETSVKKLRIEGESDFKCAKCLFTCKDKSKFRMHILDHKAAETYQCFECGLCFAVLPSLRKHVFMVHKVRDFDSYMEENQIKEPTVLEDKDVDIIREPEPDKREERDESSEEEANGDPLECKVCYRSFDNERLLKSHMRTHGMAFIKKSRRRAQNISPVKRVENEASYSSSQDEGKQEGLVLKLKRLKPAKYSNTAETKASVDGEINIDVKDTNMET